MFGMSVKTGLLQFKKFELLQTGDVGSGKTTRALTASRFGPVYFFDFDGKIQGAVRNLSDVDKEKIFYDSYKERTFEEAFKKLKELQALYVKGESPFATVVIDTFTMLNEKSYVKAMGKKLDVSGSKADFDVWGIIQNDLLNFFNVLHSLPCNLIVNCHVAKSENVEGKEVLGVEGMGQFRNRIAKKMTDAHYLYFDVSKFNIRAKKSSSVPANSNIQEKFIDKVGNLTTLDLSVFDDYAFKVLS